LVYAQGLTAQRVADSITSLAAPAASDTLLKLPAVPEGFRLTISSTSQPDMIRTDGAIFPVATQTAVTVILEVTKVSDGSHALTQPIEVTVPAKVIVDTGNSNKKDEDHNNAVIQQQPGFSEQGKAVIIHIPSTAFLDGQINQARLEGKAYADIHLEQEKNI
ncbi:peptidase m28, partial [Paenibacillus sp. 28ISP30-2]|nr:peptidase m28 [Paenibacillus sp. 28ISP30-2]